MLRIIAILLLCFIAVNLFVGLFHILRGKDRGAKAVRILAIRVALSVLLFLLIIISA
ncbi:MAG: DUF2909 domain-containing protein, partial [Betaproteobacteria bacterium]|nr:DUF2909 domain-containing protein [Betaproteobacteria bacterium]